MARKSFTHEGKRIFVSGKTEEEAIANRERRKLELESGETILGKSMLVSSWVEQYLEVYKRPLVSDDQFNFIEACFRLHILPYIGSIPIKDVKAIDCQRVMNGMVGYSGGYILKIHGILNTMFKVSENNQLIRRNPAAFITVPKGPSGHFRALTPNEKKVFLKACEISPYGLWGLYLLYTGAGPGESAKLLGQHIDFEKRTIYIDGTKTEYRPRTVPMNDILYERFSEIKLTPFQPVFQNKDGKPLSKTALKRRWASLIKEMNILMGCATDYGELKRVLPPYAVAPDLRAYCLRHTYATDLRDAGIDITVAMRYMGHGSAKMLTEIYIGMTQLAFDESLEKMNSYNKRMDEASLDDVIPSPLVTDTSQECVG